MIATPIVKSAGGKTRLLDELVARMPARFGRYFEPFAGGAALFFRVAPGRAVLADANPDLIATYRAVAADVEAVIVALQRHRAFHSRDHYYATRARWNDRHRATAAERAAAFIYLNKTCFNGLWRVNRTGAFNVPMGRYRDPAICNPNQLRIAFERLRRAELHAGDYREVLSGARRGDFAYIDPPYDGTFTAYTSSAFGDADQAELAFTVRTLAARGVAVMASNADTPRIRALYAGLRIDAVTAPRAISCRGSQRRHAREVIITAGYEPPALPIIEAAQHQSSSKRRRSSTSKELHSAKERSAQHARRAHDD